MPRKTIRDQKQGLNSKELEALTAYLHEANTRGLDVAQLLDENRNDQYIVNWHTNDDGYFVKEDGVSFEPNSDNQRSFLESDARFVGFFGGRGSGKTCAGAQKALRKIKQGESGLVINPSFENLKISTWPELRQWIPWNMVIDRQLHMKEQGWVPAGPFKLVFKNGAEMTMKGLNNPESARGPNVNWFWYDEGGSDMEGLAFQLAIASVRIGKNPQVWVTTTPKGRSHWIYKFFVAKDIPKDAIKAFEETGENRVLIEYYTNAITNNKTNLDPSFYASMLASYTGHLRQQELEGLFVDAGLAMGQEIWFKDRLLPGGVREDQIKRAVRYWDLAATEQKISKTKKKQNDPDYTCGGRIVYRKNKTYVIDDIRRGQLIWSQIIDLIVTTAQSDGPAVEIWIEQEPASGGKNQVAALASLAELAGYVVRGHNPRDIGDKIVRANPWYAKAEQGLVYLTAAEWNRAFLDQFASFPLVSHDDIIDVVSGGFHVISPMNRIWKKTEYMSFASIDKITEDLNGTK